MVYIILLIYIIFLNYYVYVMGYILFKNYVYIQIYFDIFNNDVYFQVNDIVLFVGFDKINIYKIVDLKVGIILVI